MEGVQIGNISIPLIKGEKGNKGDTGTIVSISVTMLSSTSTPYANNTGTPENAVIELGIPRGTGIASATINEDGELVLTLTDNTELNLGVVIATSISNVSIDSQKNFIVELSDGTNINVGNLATEIQDDINTALADYYDKTTSDGKFALITETGNKIDLSMNNTTYVMTLNLKDKNNNILSTGTIDLPLESVVVSGSYDNTTKEVILTLQGGSTVEFSVADLVAGLQSEITSSNKLSADLVSDTNTTNKFVTASEKTTWNSKANTSDIPTKTSDLNNDNGFITKSVSDLDNYYTKTEINTKFDDYYTKTQIDNIIGDINTILDNINGEVV